MVHSFRKGIYSKVNVIARLEFEIAYNDSGGQRFKDYNTGTPPNITVIYRQLTTNIIHCNQFCDKHKKFNRKERDRIR